jgi:hypothetical protein
MSNRRQQAVLDLARNERRARDRGEITAARVGPIELISEAITVLRKAVDVEDLDGCSAALALLEEAAVQAWGGCDDTESGDHP